MVKINIPNDQFSDLKYFFLVSGCNDICIDDQNWLVCFLTIFATTIILFCGNS